MIEKEDGTWVDGIYYSLDNVLKKCKSVDTSVFESKPSIEDLIDLFRLIDVYRKNNAENLIVWLPSKEYLDEISIKWGNFSREVDIESTLRKMSNRYKNFVNSFCKKFGVNVNIFDTLNPVVLEEVDKIKEKKDIVDFIKKTGKLYYGYKVSDIKDTRLRKIYVDNYSGLLAQYSYCSETQQSIVVESPAEIPAIEDAAKLTEVSFASTISCTDLYNKGTWRMYGGEGKLNLFGCWSEILESLRERESNKSWKKSVLAPLLTRYAVFSEYFGIDREEVIDLYNSSKTGSLNFDDSIRIIESGIKNAVGVLNE